MISLSELREGSGGSGGSGGAARPLRRVLAMLALTALLWLLVIVAIGRAKGGDGQVAFAIFGPCAVTPISAGLLFAEILVAGRARPREMSREGDMALVSWLWCLLLLIACVLTVRPIVTGSGL